MTYLLNNIHIKVRLGRTLKRLCKPFYFLLNICFIFCLVFVLPACRQDKPEPQNFLIGVINPNKGIHEINRGFIEGLAAYGYTEGENTTFIHALSSSEIDRTLKELTEKNADLIFTVTTPATKKALKAAKEKEIPVVFALHDPVSAGVIESLPNPGKNTTGIQMRGSASKALDWLLELSPEIKNIFIPVKFDTPAAKQSLADLKKVTNVENINLFVSEVVSQSEIEKAFLAMPENIDAVFLLNSIFVSSNAEQIVKKAVEHKLPVGSGSGLYLKGATITFGVNWERTGKQASRLAKMVLQGHSAENLPAEVADFYLGVNMETAYMSGINVPNDILSQADYIIPHKGSDSKDD